MSWHPSKEEIQYWIEAKEHDFYLLEMQVLWVNTKELKGVYLYFYLHEIFFVEFPCLLHEWLKTQAGVS